MRSSEDAPGTGAMRMLLPDDAGSRVLEAIVGGRHAWTAEADLLSRGHEPDELIWLEATGWLAPWDLADGRAWTLTPWAAEVLGYELVEHWEFQTVTEIHQGATGLVTVRAREAIETPAWKRRPPEPKPGDPKPKARPIKTPRHAREGQLRFPERVVDPAPGPEYLAVMNEETGEVEEVVLFQGPDGRGAGLKVRRDRRMKRYEAKIRARAKTKGLSPLQPEVNLHDQPDFRGLDPAWFREEEADKGRAG